MLIAKSLYVRTHRHKSTLWTDHITRVWPTGPYLTKWVERGGPLDGSFTLLTNCTWEEDLTWHRALYCLWRISTPWLIAQHTQVHSISSPAGFAPCLAYLPLEAQDVGVSWHCVLHVAKTKILSDAPPFDWATELLPLMALEAIKYDETGLHVLNQLLLPGKTHYEEIKSVEDAWDAIKTMKVLGST